VKRDARIAANATGTRTTSSTAGADAAEDAAPASAIVARGIAAVVGGRRIWGDVNLDVPSGSFAVILGPNGVGKSTLLKAVLGLQPVSGELRVLGAPAGARRSMIGYVPQRGSFDPSVRIRGSDVVRLGIDGDRWGVTLPGRRSRDERMRVDELIRLVEAEAYASRPIGRLSGGEQQRLIIAQALARRPQLLLLDEPLDSLDLSSQGAVAALIQRICRQQAVTVVMVAHDVNPILPYIDRVIYLAGGAAVSGSPAEVITSDTLSALYGTNVEVLRASDGSLVVVGQPEAPAHHTDRHEP
jgi:zinc/manganese transport system ATP-binding protein